MGIGQRRTIEYIIYAGLLKLAQVASQSPVYLPQ